MRNVNATLGSRALGALSLSISTPILCIGLLGLLLPPAAAQAQDCGSDTTPPVLVIESPARGTSVVAGDETTAPLAVTGFAEDSDNDLVSVVVNGQELLAGSGVASLPIDTSVDSPWGLNTISASAEDACGNRRELVHSFLRSGSYGEPSIGPDPAARVLDAITVRLGQELLDDDDPDPDDLKTLANQALSDLDWATAIPSVLQTQSLPRCSCTVPNPLGGCLVGDNWVSDTRSELRLTRGTLTVGNFGVGEIVPQQSDVQVGLALSSLSTPLTLRAYTCVLGNQTSVAVTGNLNMRTAIVTGDFRPNVTSGGAQVTTTRTAASLGSASLTFTCGIAQSLCTAMSNFIQPTLETALLDLMRDAAEDQLPPVLEAFIDSVLLPDTVPVATAAGLEMELNHVLQDASSAPGYLDIVLAQQVVAGVADVPAASLGEGPILRSPAALPAFGGESLTVAIREDTVNQLLWATWAGGGLNFPDLQRTAARHGLAVESMSATGLLPPVSQEGDVPGRSRLGIGDLRLAVTLPASEIEAGAGSAPVSASYVVTGWVESPILSDAGPQKLGFAPDAVSLSVELESIDDPSLRDAARGALDSFLEAWLSELATSLVHTLPLPMMELENLGGPDGIGIGVLSPLGTRAGGERIVFAGGIFPAGFCGDSAIRLLETCDDGNRALGDGCNDDCRIEAGFVCTGEPSSCALLCGDGFIDEGEACDDANLDDGDGCNAFCEIESGFECAGEPSACVRLCGNGLIDAGETCDDGGLLGGDGCSALCQSEVGFECSGEPSVCDAVGTPLKGTELSIKNSDPDTRRKRVLDFEAKDKKLRVAQPGSADDPRCSAPGGGGGRIEIFSSASGERVVQELPCERWKLLGTERKPKGYKYKDKNLESGPCDRVFLKNKKGADASCSGKGALNLEFDLVKGQSQGGVSVQIQTGANQLYCSQFTKRIKKNGTNGKQYLAKKNKAPDSCPIAVPR